MRKMCQTHMRTFQIQRQKVTVHSLSVSKMLRLALQKSASLQPSLHPIMILYLLLLYDYSNPRVTCFNYSRQTQTDRQSQLTAVPVLTQLCLCKLGSLPPGNESILPCCLLLDALCLRDASAPSSAFPKTWRAIPNYSPDTPPLQILDLSFLLLHTAVLKKVRDEDDGSFLRAT